MRFSLVRRLAAEAAAAVSKRPAASSQSMLPRPQLRNLLAEDTKKRAMVCFVVAISACLAYRQLIGEPRKKKYADFWRNYDSHADFKRMVKAGVLPDFTIEDVEDYERSELAKRKAAAGKK